MVSNTHQSRITLLGIIGVVVIGLIPHCTLAGKRIAPGLDIRQPVAFALDAQTLLTANRKSGTVSIVDVERGAVVDQLVIGQRLSDLCVSPDGALLVTDEADNCVRVLRKVDGRFELDQRLEVASTPVSLCQSPSHDTISVASLWSRRINLLKWDRATVSRPRLATEAVIDLPFAPRKQCFLDETNLLITDSFSGNLGIINTTSNSLIGWRTIEGHNIRGLTLTRSGDAVLISHQHLNSQMPTERSRVFWGQVVSNLLREITSNHLLSANSVRHAARTHSEWELFPATEPVHHWSLYPLGKTGNGAGDPGDIVVTPKGERIVCLSGVNEIAISEPTGRSFTRVSVGLRPIALQLDQARDYVYVANMMDDSITVVSVPRRRVVDTISLGRMPEFSMSQQGERLFYDARQSLDGWYSCHSCHTDGHTNGLLNDSFADHVAHTPKRVLSLLGVNETFPWAWKGHQHWLSDQVSMSIATTMHGSDTYTEYNSAADITKFLRELRPPPSLRAARQLSLDSPAVLRGWAIFARSNCGQCHKAPTYTSPDVYDVGLEDERGEVLFNPPSLRGVSQLHGWFHDNRAKNLHDVFAKFGHPNGNTETLTDDEIKDLVVFLQTL